MYLNTMQRWIGNPLISEKVNPCCYRGFSRQLEVRLGTCVCTFTVKAELFGQCRWQEKTHRGSVFKFETEYGLLEESWMHSVNEMGSLGGEGGSSAAPAVLIVISSTCSHAGSAPACLLSPCRCGSPGVCWPSTSTPHTAFQFPHVWGLSGLSSKLGTTGGWKRRWRSDPGSALLLSFSVCKRTTALLTSPQLGPSWVVCIWNLTMHAQRPLPLTLLP